MVICQLIIYILTLKNCIHIIYRKKYGHKKQHNGLNKTVNLKKHKTCTYKMVRLHEKYIFKATPKTETDTRTYMQLLNCVV